jgi:hypothetical protein
MRDDDDTFDLNRHLSRIRDGKAELEKRRDSIQDEIAALTSELEKVDADLERIEGLDLDAVLGPAPQRMTGVLQVVEGVAMRMLEDGSVVAEADIVHGVKFSGAKSGSVRSALSRLVERGTVCRTGKRGSWSYFLPKTESDASSEPSAEAPETDLLSRVLSALAEAGAAGMLQSDLYLKLNLGLDSDGAMNEILKDDRIVCREGRYRDVVSDAAAQAKPFQQRTLFDGAEPPPAHAAKD